MKSFIYTSIFKKNLKKLQKKHYDMDLLKNVLQFLQLGQVLPGKYHDHALTGDLQGFRECHIQPNWLLLYKETEEEIQLLSTGSHDDLFK